MSSLLLLSGLSQGRMSADLESGYVVPGYNDVRIPGDGGTDLSLSQELKTDPAPFFRIRLGLDVGSRGSISLLYAPLRLNAHGSLDRELKYNGVTFPAGTPLRATYRFDSYRLTYRYDFIEKDKVRFGAGVTGKIRDAGIGVDGQEFTEKTNTGFVPLINFSFNWQFKPSWELAFEGDALAAPQGRAEDVLSAFRYRFNDNVCGRFGYRLLEGGADNAEVYNFTMVHYFAAGLTAFF
jgi:hypothetical protein